METLYTGSHSTVQLKDVLDGETGVPVDNATVEFTLYDRDGQEVTGQPWPLSLIPISSGLYAGTLEADLDLKHNWEYQGYCKAQSLDGVVMEIHCPMVAKDRSCCE